MKSKEIIDNLAIELAEKCGYDWVSLKSKDEYFKVDRKLFIKISKMYFKNTVVKKCVKIMKNN